MEPREMKELVSRFVEEFWNKGDFESALGLMTNDLVVHAPVDSLESLKGLVTAFRVAFPDWQSTPEEMVVEGDTVVERWTGRGTHQGPFLGAPATGRRVAIPGVVFYRIRDRKIAEFRGYSDQYALLQQLGLLPEPASASQ